MQFSIQPRGCPHQDIQSRQPLSNQADSAAVLWLSHNRKDLSKLSPRPPKRKQSPWQAQKANEYCTAVWASPNQPRKAQKLNGYAPAWDRVEPEVANRNQHAASGQARMISHRSLYSEKTKATDENRATEQSKDEQNDDDCR